MKKIFWLLGGKEFSIDEIQGEKSPEGLAQYEKDILDFGRSWINGKSQFALQTSGSTGIPREFTIRRSQMEASAKLTERALDLQPGFTCLLCLDVHRIAGQMMLVRSLVTRMNLIAVAPSANPLEGLRQGQSEIDFTAFVPYQLQAMLNDPAAKSKLEEIKTVIVGGAPISKRLETQINSLKCQVYATYGMTETISHIALQQVNGADRQNYFEVLPGISIDSDHRGCLTIKADYLGEEKVVTNDLVDILSPDRFRWLGRVDFVINTGGFKVIPEEIEIEVGKVFHDLGLQNRFLISGIADAKLGNRVVLIVEGETLDRVLVAKILEKLRAMLKTYESPKEILAIKQFAETPTQKINRVETLLKIQDSNG